jgi:hypothetical protein
MPPDGQYLLVDAERQLLIAEVSSQERSTLCAHLDIARRIRGALTG